MNVKLFIKDVTPAEPQDRKGHCCNSMRLAVEKGFLQDRFQFYTEKKDGKTFNGIASFTTIISPDKRQLPLVISFCPFCKKKQAQPR